MKLICVVNINTGYILVMVCPTDCEQDYWKGLQTNFYANFRSSIFGAVDLKERNNQLYFAGDVILHKNVVE